MDLLLIALLLGTQAAAGPVPDKAQAPPDETYTVECTFANPAYSGPCGVTEKVSQKLTPRAACTEILGCLNNTQCSKTYCNATTVRGGWSLLKAERRPDGAPSGPVPSPTIPNPRIVVHKARRELLVYSGSELLKTYRVGLGLKPVPPKEREGDRATPEGTYVVCMKNPASEFTLSLGLSYPNAADAERGLKSGLVTSAQHARIVESARSGSCPPWDTPLGGEIFIHGSGSATDWTWGCVALDDDDIRELYPRIPVGTPVVIEP